MLNKQFFIAYPFELNPLEKDFFKEFYTLFVAYQVIDFEGGDVDYGNYCVMIIKSHSEKLTQLKKEI